MEPSFSDSEVESSDLDTLLEQELELLSDPGDDSSAAGNWLDDALSQKVPVPPTCASTGKHVDESSEWSLFEASSQALARYLQGASEVASETNSMLPPPPWERTSPPSPPITDQQPLSPLIDVDDNEAVAHKSPVVIVLKEEDPAEEETPYGFSSIQQASVARDAQSLQEVIALMEERAKIVSERMAVAVDVAAASAPPTSGSPLNKNSSSSKHQQLLLQSMDNVDELATEEHKSHEMASNLAREENLAETETPCESEALGTQDVQSIQEAAVAPRLSHLREQRLLEEMAALYKLPPAPDIEATESSNVEKDSEPATNVLAAALASCDEEEMEKRVAKAAVVERQKQQKDWEAARKQAFGQRCVLQLQSLWRGRSTRNMTAKPLLSRRQQRQREKEEREKMSREDALCKADAMWQRAVLREQEIKDKVAAKKAADAAAILESHASATRDTLLTIVLEELIASLVAIEYENAQRMEAEAKAEIEAQELKKIVTFATEMAIKDSIDNVVLDVVYSMVHAAVGEVMVDVRAENAAAEVRSAEASARRIAAAVSDTHTDRWRKTQERASDGMSANSKAKAAALFTNITSSNIASGKKSISSKHNVRHTYDMIERRRMQQRVAYAQYWINGEWKSSQELQEVVQVEDPETQIQLSAGLQQAGDALTITSSLLAHVGSLAALSSLELCVEGITAIGPLLAPCTSLRSLSLSVNRISSISTDLRSCTAIEELSICDNRLMTLHGLETLTNLTSLRVDVNQLASLCTLPALPALIELSARTNRIICLPVALPTLCLQRLDLFHNRLKTLPPRSLQHLTALTHLDLGRNLLGGDEHENENTSISISIEKSTSLGLALTACPTLQTLVISQNGLCSPPSPLRLPLLRELWLSGNRIHTLQPWDTANLTGSSENMLGHLWLPSLLSLHLQDNGLKSLGSGVGLSGAPLLQALDLSFNALADTALTALSSCRRLVTLQTHDNPISEREHIKTHKADVLKVAPWIRWLNGGQVDGASTIESIATSSSHILIPYLLAQERAGQPLRCLSPPPLSPSLAPETAQRSQHNDTLEPLEPLDRITRELSVKLDWAPALRSAWEGQRDRMGYREGASVCGEECVCASISLDRGSFESECVASGCRHALRQRHHRREAGKLDAANADLPLAAQVDARLLLKKKHAAERAEDVRKQLLLHTTVPPRVSPTDVPPAFWGTFRSRPQGASQTSMYSVSSSNAAESGLTVEEATKRLQSLLRHVKARRRANHMSGKAAVKLQCVFRGYHVRRALQAALESSKYIDDELDDLEELDLDSFLGRPPELDKAWEADHIVSRTRRRPHPAEASRSMSGAGLRPAANSMNGHQPSNGLSSREPLHVSTATLTSAHASQSSPSQGPVHSLPPVQGEETVVDEWAMLQREHHQRLRQKQMPEPSKSNHEDTTLQSDNTSFDHGMSHSVDRGEVTVDVEKRTHGKVERELMEEWGFTDTNVVSSMLLRRRRLRRFELRGDNKSTPAQRKPQKHNPAHSTQQSNVISEDVNNTLSPVKHENRAARKAWGTPDSSQERSSPAFPPSEHESNVMNDVNIHVYNSNVGGGSRRRAPLRFQAFELDDSVASQSKGHTKLPAGSRSSRP